MQERTREKVSAIIPVRNGQPWVSDFIQNINAVLQENDELIFIDDDSQDDTFRILHSFQYLFPNMRVVKNPGKGIVSALNYGIEISQNQILARFDIDDCYAHNRLDLQVESLGNQNGACFSDYSFWGDGNRYLGKVPSAVFPLSTLVSLFSSQRTAHPSVIFRKSAFYEAGGYKEEEFPAEDLGLWFRIAKFATIVSTPAELLFYNLRLNSTSSKKRKFALDMKQQLVLENLHQVGKIKKEFEQIVYDFNTYVSLEYSFERQFLLLRELSLDTINTGLGKVQRNWVMSNMRSLLTSPKNIFRLMTLTKDKIRRDSFRKKNSRLTLRSDS